MTSPRIVLAYQQYLDAAARYCSACCDWCEDERPTTPRLPRDETVVVDMRGASFVDVWKLAAEGGIEEALIAGAKLIAEKGARFDTWIGHPDDARALGIEGVVGDRAVIVAQTQKDAVNFARILGAPIEECQVILRR